MPSFSTAGRSSTSRWNCSGARAAMRAAVSARYCGVQKLAGVSTRYLRRAAAETHQGHAPVACPQSPIVERQLLTALLKPKVDGQSVSMGTEYPGMSCELAVSLQVQVICSTLPAVSTAASSAVLSSMIRATKVPSQDACRLR